MGVRLLLTGILSFGTLASSTPLCSISIHEELNNGKVQYTAFKTELSSKAACATLAGMHQKNFSPDRIRHKTVSYGWLGKKSAAQVASRKLHVNKKSTLAYRRSQRLSHKNVY